MIAVALAAILLGLVLGFFIPPYGFLAAAVGLVYWCHRWLEDGKAPLPRRAAFHMRDGVLRGRTLRTRQAVRPSVLTVARFAPADGPKLRMVRSNSFPSNAA